MAKSAGHKGNAPVGMIVLGAGIAGLSAADKLLRAGHKVTILECSEACGGAHRSFTIGPYTFDQGSIFYEEGAKIFELAEGLAQQCPKVIRLQRRISPNGNVRHYPIEPKELVRSSPLKFLLGMGDMLLSRVLVRRDGTLDAILRKRLGGRFARETGLHAYIKRFHHVRPEEVDEAFFFYRMAFVEYLTRFKPMIRSGLRTLFTRRSFKNRKRAPLHIRPFAGYEPLFDAIRERLEKDGADFVFGAQINSITRQGSGFTVETDKGQFGCSDVISTIPINSLHQILFGKSTQLETLDMTSLFVSASRLDESTGNVLFNFHEQGDWKRATIYSRLYPEAKTDRVFFTVEATIAPGAKHDPQASFEDFSRHISALGLADDLKLEGSTCVAAAYPLYRPGSNALLDEAIERIAATGVMTLGRQGRFAYLPTSTAVINQVGEALGALAIAPQAPSNPPKLAAEQGAAAN